MIILNFYRVTPPVFARKSSPEISTQIPSKGNSLGQNFNPSSDTSFFQEPTPKLEKEVIQKPMVSKTYFFLYEGEFNSFTFCLDSWKNLCQLQHSSDFLMAPKSWWKTSLQRLCTLSQIAWQRQTFQVEERPSQDAE